MSPTKYEKVRKYENTKTEKWYSFVYSYHLVFRRQKRRRRSGQAMLISILMITAAALAIGLAVAAIGSSELVQTVAYRQSAQAYGLAETCLEDQLMRLARVNYSQATPQFTNSFGSCTIVLSAGPPYTITSTGIAGRAERILKLVVNVNNPSAVATDERLSITSWEEIYQ